MSNKKAETLARVMEVAVREFGAKPYEQVSVADIATSAKCSLATIYSVFGAKEQLYVEATLKMLDLSSWSASPRGGGSPLIDLLEFLQVRIIGLHRATQHSYLASTMFRLATLRDQMVTRIAQTGGLDFVVAMTNDAMERGLIRKAAPEKVAYLMLSGTGYEPVMYSLVFGEDAAIDAATILDNILSPIVTDVGAEELQAFLKTSTRECAGTAPTLTRYLHSAASKSGLPSAGGSGAGLDS